MNENQKNKWTKKQIVILFLLLRVSTLSISAVEYADWSYPEG